jgi:hypothetical protein
VQGKADFQKVRDYLWECIGPGRSSKNMLYRLKKKISQEFEFLLVKKKEMSHH